MTLDSFREWDELTAHEKILTFPERHPYPFRCALYLYVTTGAPWAAITAVMRAMGYVLMDLRLDIGGVSLGAPTYLAEDLNRSGDIEER